MQSSSALASPSAGDIDCWPRGTFLTRSSHKLATGGWSNNDLPRNTESRSGCLGRSLVGPGLFSVKERPCIFRARGRTLGRGRCVGSRTRAPSGANGREVGDMSVPLEQMLEELRKAEHARDLLSEVERRLSAGNTDLENLLRQLELLGQSLPESDPIRLLIDDAVGAARTRDSIKAGSDVSRSRSAIEGEISSLRGAIQSVQARSDL